MTKSYWEQHKIATEQRFAALRERGLTLDNRPGQF
jgi:hypothetical protein